MANPITQEQASNYRNSWHFCSQRNDKLDAVLLWAVDKLKEDGQYDLAEEINAKWADALCDT